MTQSFSNIPASDILAQLQRALVRPVHPRGVLWVGSAALLLLINLLSRWDSAGFVFCLTGLLYICFRDPARVPPDADGIIVAPADGIVTDLGTAPWPLETERDGTARRVVISPRFYDVHVLRAPVAAALTEASTVLGQWGSNPFDKSAVGHERAVVTFKLADGRPLVLEVIGGLLPERIRLSARAGDVVSVGQAVGYAAFGGEVRLYLPEDVEMIVRRGQRMTAGETPIAADQVRSHDEQVVDSFGILPNSAPVYGE